MCIKHRRLWDRSHPLAVEGFVGTNKLFPRFIDSNQLATETENSLAQLFEEGLRWNTQVYCFPQVDESEIDTDDNRLTIKSCLPIIEIQLTGPVFKL